MKFYHLETDNYHFQYIEEGDGLPLVFLHGYPGRPQDFRWLFPFLSQFKIISLGLPNLDLTTTKNGFKSPTTITERADSIQEFLIKKDIKQCLVVTHSMGGPIGTALAKQNPDRVLGLVLISSVGLYPYRAFRASKAPLAHKVLSAPFLGTLLRPLMKKMFYRLGFPKGVSVEAMRYVLHCAHDFSFAEHTKNISTLECPILSVWSENDPLIENQSQLDLANALQNGSILSFKTGMHNPQREFPQEIAEALQTWFMKSVSVQKTL